MHEHANVPEQFQALLEKKDLKFTFERRSIYDEIAHMKQHFDADSLYDRLKKKGLRISRDTVYRTIPLLLESGVVQKSVGKGHRDFYERTSARGHHDHMVCIRCGKFIEFTCDEIETLQEKICKKYSFEMIFHDHRLYGVCHSCQGHPKSGGL